MKEIKTSKGVLKYRLPNVAEGYTFLALAESMDTTTGYFETQAKIIEKMENLVDYKSVGYESYESCLADSQNMFKPLGKIAQEIINDLNEVLLKKD